MEGLELIIFKCNHKFNAVERISSKDSHIIEVSENDFIYLKIVSDSELHENNFLWLSDLKFILIFDQIIERQYHYNIITDAFFGFREKEKFSHIFLVEGFHRTFSKLFINNYGICEIELETTREIKTEYFHLVNIKVNSEKISDIQYLLTYLLEKDVYYWESLSLTKNEAANHLKDKDNILWVINRINIIIKEFNSEFIPQLINDVFYKLVPEYKVANWSENNTISEESLSWIIENSNNLETASYYDEDKFLLLSKNYKIKEIYTQSFRRDTNIPENQIIHSFISEIYYYLNICQGIINNKNNQIERNLDFKSQMLKSYFERLIIVVKNLQNQLVKIKNVLDIYIPVNFNKNVNIESYRIDSKGHYQGIFKLINLYHLNKEAIFSQDILFSGTNDISKLYEIFCLFKLIDIIVNDLNFEVSELDESLINPYKVSQDNLLSGEILIHSLYSFNKRDVKVNLYYELLPNSLTSVVRGGSRSYRPDFILEIIKDNAISYVILDAKYKKVGSIQNHDYEELTLKYLHGISPKNGGRFNVMGLIIINPIIGSGIDFFQRGNFSMFGKNPSLPLIGRVELNVEQTQSFDLLKILQYFLSIDT